MVNLNTFNVVIFLGNMHIKSETQTANYKILLGTCLGLKINSYKKITWIIVCFCGLFLQHEK